MKAADLIAKANYLKAPSPAVARLLSLLSQPEGDNEELIHIIEQDAPVSAKLLGMCNSAVYGLATPVSSMEQAVLYLGHSEIHRLALNAGFSDKWSPAPGGHAIREGELWQHSLLTARVAVMLAENGHEPAVDPAIAYTGGLIHDIGKIVIGRAITPEQRDTVLGLIGKNEHSLCSAERAVLGTDHAEVGAALLEKWRLPKILIEAVAHHHQPVCKPELKLSALVHVADLIALETGPAPAPGSFAGRADANAIEALQLTPESLEELILKARDALAGMQSAPVP
jgi:putative nucleotidyltransferase with HDIG domain